MYTLHLDDYFDAEELNPILDRYGYIMVDRRWDAVSTSIDIEPQYDAVDIDELVTWMRDELYVSIDIA